MVERLHRVGGKLEIKSGVGKTIVKADIPVNDQQVAPPELALDPL
jgi:signal transduction histidine kinase